MTTYLTKVVAWSDYSFYCFLSPERHIYPDGLQRIQQPWLKFTTRYHVPIYSCLEFNFEVRNKTAGFFSIVLEQDNYLDTVFQLRGLKNTGQLIKASLPLNVTKRSPGQNKFRVSLKIYCKMKVDSIILFLSKIVNLFKTFKFIHEFRYVD